MHPGAWLTFASASLAIGIMPGPGVASIVGHALGAGRRTALAAAAGMAVGNALAMSLSLAGVGAILATSALAFVALKWLGAVYLVVLGVRTLRRAGTAAGHAPPRIVAPIRAFFGTVAVGTFHPKTILFFVAFAPQFIDRREAYPLQAALLVSTFCTIVGVTDAIYAIAAAKAAAALGRGPARVWTERAGGGALIASGLAIATTVRR